MGKHLTRPWFKALAALSINLSAGWFAAVLIVPNFSSLQNLADFGILTYDLFLGILFLRFTVKIEEVLEP